MDVVMETALDEIHSHVMRDGMELCVRVRSV
jgi:hypothetical protein